MDDGRSSYKLERPWPDGRTHLVLYPASWSALGRVTWRGRFDSDRIMP